MQVVGRPAFVSDSRPMPANSGTCQDGAADASTNKSLQGQGEGRKMAEEIEAAPAPAAEEVPKQPKVKAERVKQLPRQDREAFDADIAVHQARIAANHNRMVRTFSGFACLTYFMFFTTLRAENTVFACSNHADTTRAFPCAGHYKGAGRGAPRGKEDEWERLLGDAQPRPGTERRL